jgi:hypothetical protein
LTVNKAHAAQHGTVQSPATTGRTDIAKFIDASNAMSQTIPSNQPTSTPLHANGEDNSPAHGTNSNDWSQARGLADRPVRITTHRGAAWVQMIAAMAALSCTHKNWKK